MIQAVDFRIFSRAAKALKFFAPIFFLIYYLPFIMIIGTYKPALKAFRSYFIVDITFASPTAAQMNKLLRGRCLIFSYLV